MISLRTTANKYVQRKDVLALIQTPPNLGTSAGANTSGYEAMDTSIRGLFG